MSAIKRVDCIPILVPKQKLSCTIILFHKATGKTSIYFFGVIKSQDTCKCVTCLMLLFSFPQHLKNRRIRVDIAGQQQQQGEEFIFISSVAQYNVMKLSLYPQLSFPLTFEFVNEILCCDHSNESY